MSKKKKYPRNLSSIASDVPGRIRIKLHPQNRQPAIMDRLKEKMETHAGITARRRNIGRRPRSFILRPSAVNL
jgi:hypothetical protein